MGSVRKALFGAGFVIAAGVSIVPAHAAVIITSPSSFPLINLGSDGGTGFQNATPRTDGALTTTFSNGSGIQNGFATGIYSGTSSVGAYTSPFGASSNQDYYAVQPGGSIGITFSTAQTSFGLLFGTADSYNNLIFTTTGANGSQSFSGTDVMNAVGSNSNGTVSRYILFSGLNSFTTVTATDTQQSAFEFVPAAVATTVPEPVSLVLLGTGLVGMGALRRRFAK